MPDVTETMELKTRLEWSGRNYRTSHDSPRRAVLLEGRGHGGQRRVGIMGDYQVELRRQNSSYKDTTTWLYNEDGTLAGAGPEWTLIAVDTALPE